MKLKKKRFIYMVVAIAACMMVMLLTACGGAKVSELYDAVCESQSRLDLIADDIYQCWYDAIYNDEYSSDINVAIYTAQIYNSDNLNFVKENDEKIQSIYKDVRDSDLKSEIKAVMLAYNDYYELVINVSGSFNNYSQNKETYKKQLAAALKNLEMEL